jgi:hypothetical protein
MVKPLVLRDSRVFNMDTLKNEGKNSLTRSSFYLKVNHYNLVRVHSYRNDKEVIWEVLIYFLETDSKKLILNSKRAKK